MLTRSRTFSDAAHGPARSAAFSLIELILVIVIIGVVSAIAVPHFGHSISRHGVDGAARRIAADLDLARRRAMTTGATQTFRWVSGADPGYTLVGTPHLDRPTETYFVSLRRDCNGAEPVAQDFNGDSDLVFDMYGVPDSSAQIVIRAGAHKRTIDVDAFTGAVHVSE